MAISYNKLWKLLVDKKMSKADLRKAAGIAPNTMTRLRRDEEVTLTVLNKICKTLGVDIGDIIGVPAGLMCIDTQIGYCWAQTCSDKEERLSYV